MDHASVNIGTVQSSLRRDRHLDDYREPIDIEVKRRKIGGQFFRQHREDLTGRIYRGGVLSRVIVDGAVLLYQCIDVRNRDEYSGRISGERFGGGQLVQIARIIIVDGTPEQVA